MVSRLMNRRCKMTTRTVRGGGGRPEIWEFSEELQCFVSHNYRRDDPACVFDSFEVLGCLGATRIDS